MDCARALTLTVCECIRDRVNGLHGISGVLARAESGVFSTLLRRGPVLVLLPALFGCCAGPPRPLVATVRENETLRRENLFLRRHMGRQALTLLMNDLNGDRLSIRRGLDDNGGVASAARRLAGDIVLIPSLAGSLGLKEPRRAEMGALADDASDAARHLSGARATADPAIIRARLDALEMACAACHVSFGVLSKLPEVGHP